MSTTDRPIARTAIEDNLQSITQFLRQYPPFMHMDRVHLAYLIEHCVLRFYAKDEPIIQPQDGPVEHFYIVKQGRIVGRRGAEDAAPTFEITQGECFPISALLAERPTRTAHIAATDTFCLALNKKAFTYLLGHRPAFQDYCLLRISGLLDEAMQHIRQQAAANVGTQHTLDTTLGELLLREPVTANPHMPLYQGVRLMDEQQVGSLPVINEAGFPIGIFTLRDLRAVIASPKADLNQPLAQVMTPAPHYLTPKHTAFDATLAMAEHHIAHICVVENKRLVGMVSERDLFALQRMDLVHLARALRNAPTVAALVQLREEVEQLMQRMFTQGASPEQLTHLITLLNDHTSTRVIELKVAEHPAPLPEFTWLVFGSEARQEQTLYTDQDNGILFHAETQTEAEAIRRQLLPLAKAINEALHECGFTWCPGRIMASNPELCLSFSEWQQRFAGLVRETSPQNLLLSTIFFDFRGLWGSTEAVEQLRHQVLAQSKENPAFQRALAQSALQHRPPLGGLFRDFTLSKKGEHKNTLNLKTEGLTPFVDGMRVLALSHGVAAVNTLERLRELKSRGVIDALDADAYAEAYHFIQLLRMQGHQEQRHAGKPFSNRIAPHSLNHLDRRILRESLRQAQRLQNSLSFRYKL